MSTSKLDTERNQEADELRAGFAAQTEPPTDEEKESLKLFRGKLREMAICKHYNDIEMKNISLDVINAINYAIDTGGIAEDAGWIRARSNSGELLRAS